MDLKKIKNQLAKNYLLRINQEMINNQFIATQFHVTPMDGHGLGFTIGFNDNGQPSMLTMDEAHMDRFNIAEGYTSDDILKVMQDILEGRFTEKRSRLTKRRRLVFDTSCGKIYAALDKNASTQAYPKG